MTSSTAALSSIVSAGAPTAAGGGSSVIVRRTVGGALTGGIAASAFLVPRGGGFPFRATKEEAEGDGKDDATIAVANEQRRQDGRRWMSKYRKPLVAILASVYVFYPISLLLLFRISETISGLRLFEHHHRCHQLAEPGHCASLVAIHGGQFAAWLALVWAYRKRADLPCSFAVFAASIFVVVLGLYKGLVDEYLLFDPSVDLDEGRTDLTGKVAVVTGANRGIGLATAQALAGMGAHVVLTCRSMAKCQPVVDDINEKGGGSASAAILDLRSLESAYRLSEALTNTYPNIDYVFCNAGTTPQYALTEDGLEDAFGGMHLGHMALVLGLLPSLQRSKNDSAGNGNDNGSGNADPSRVIMVSSEMAINAAIGLFTPSDPTLEEFFSRDNVRGEITRGDGTFPQSLPAYGRAKLANVLFALELNRRMSARAEGDDEVRPVISHAVHTGAVNTESSRRSVQTMFAEQWPRWIHPGLGWLVGHIYFPFLWRPVRGGARVLLCAALSRDDVIRRGGQYLDALCHPFLPVEETDEIVRELVESGDIREDVVSMGNWTMYIDAIQALQLVDARHSGRLWQLSLELLEQSPAKPVTALL